MPTSLSVRLSYTQTQRTCHCQIYLFRSHPLDKSTGIKRSHPLHLRTARKPRCVLFFFSVGITLTRPPRKKSTYLTLQSYNYFRNAHSNPAGESFQAQTEYRTRDATMTKTKEDHPTR
jgi:hypothetical protein